MPTNAKALTLPDPGNGKTPGGAPGTRLPTDQDLLHFPSASVPVVRAEDVLIEDPDHTALYSAKTEKEARQFLAGHAEKYISRPRTLLEHQREELQRALAGVKVQWKNALVVLKTIPSTKLATPGSVGLRWPASIPMRWLVSGAILGGVFLTGLGWWNSAHVALIFLQNPLWSYGFTAPLLFLVVAVHLVTRQLGNRTHLIVSLALGAMALSGGAVLICELGGATNTSGDFFDQASTGPNALHLLIGQVLLEVGSGVLLIQQAEQRLRCAIETIPNEEYEAQVSRIDSLKAACEDLTAKLGHSQAELKAIKSKAEDWVRRHILRWKARNA